MFRVDRQADLTISRVTGLLCQCDLRVAHLQPGLSGRVQIHVDQLVIGRISVEGLVPVGTEVVLLAVDLDVPEAARLAEPRFRGDVPWRTLL